MQRLREHTVDPKTELHKATITFNYDKSNLLPSLDGQGLLSVLTNEIGNNIEEYSTRKVKLIETVGYEQGSYSTNITFRIPESWNNDPLGYLVDFSLGLISSIDTEKIEIQDKRFGIVAPELTQVIQGGLLKVNSVPAGKAKMLFYSEASSHQIRVVVDIYTPHGIPEKYAVDYQKARFKSDLIEILLNSKGEKFTGELKFRFPHMDDLCSLDSLYSVSKLCLLLYESFQKGKTVNSELWLESKRLAYSQIDPVQFVNFFDENHVKLCCTLIDVVTIAKRLDMPLDTKVKIGELMQQADVFQLQSNLLTGKGDSSLMVSFQVKDIEGELPTCFPVLLQTIIGDCKVIFSVVLLGYPKIVYETPVDVPEKYQLATDAPVYKQHWLDSRDGTSNQALKAMLQSVLNEYSKSHNVIMIDEYQNLLDS